MLDAKTVNEGNFNFRGLENGHLPLSYFDHYDWANCLHAVCLMLYLMGSKTRAFNALADNGMVHELVHLNAGLDISSDHTLVELRKEVENLQIKFLETIT